MTTYGTGASKVWRGVTFYWSASLGVWVTIPEDGA